MDRCIIITEAEEKNKELSNFDIQMKISNVMEEINAVDQRIEKQKELFMLQGERYVRLSKQMIFDQIQTLHMTNEKILNGDEIRIIDNIFNKCVADSQSEKKIHNDWCPLSLIFGHFLDAQKLAQSLVDIQNSSETILIRSEIPKQLFCPNNIKGFICNNFDCSFMHYPKVLQFFFLKAHCTCSLIYLAIESEKHQAGALCESPNLGQKRSREDPEREVESGEIVSEEIESEEIEGVSGVIEESNTEESGEKYDVDKRNERNRLWRVAMRNVYHNGPNFDPSHVGSLLCRFVTADKPCPFGKKCTFSHNPKTIVCPFQFRGNCRYGSNGCYKIHYSRCQIWALKLASSQQRPEVKKNSRYQSHHDDRVFTETEPKRYYDSKEDNDIKGALIHRYHYDSKGDDVERVLDHRYYYDSKGDNVKRVSTRHHYYDDDKRSGIKRAFKHRYFDDKESSKNNPRYYYDNKEDSRRQHHEDFHERKRTKVENRTMLPTFIPV